MASHNKKKPIVPTSRRHDHSNSLSPSENLISPTTMRLHQLLNKRLITSNSQRITSSSSSQRSHSKLHSNNTIETTCTPEGIYQEFNHVVAGSKLPMEEFAIQVQQTLGIQLIMSEDEVTGCISYVYQSHCDGMKLGICTNYNALADTYELESHQELISLLYLEAGIPQDQFDTLVKLEKNDGLKLILPENVSDDRLINVIDLEATCWEKRNNEKVSEIIEIGITVLDSETCEIVSTESIIIKPQVSEISEFCTSLTSLTPAFVDEHGIDFMEAIQILKDKYDSKLRIFASYGDYDRKMFERQFERLNMPNIFEPNRHMNIKKKFADVYGLKREVGMEKALNRLNIPLEGIHHRGGDDSKNIAKILINILTTESTDSR